MFQLNCESKDYFPHFFNKQNNWEYVGELPPTLEYGCDAMKVEERLIFIDWYEQQVLANKLFNFKEEIEKYCIQDVNILRIGMKDVGMKENKKKCLILGI